MNKGSMDCPFIYLNDDNFIGGYAEMMNYILKNPEIEVGFQNFSKMELMGIRALMLNYKKYLDKYNDQAHSVTVTHALRYPCTERIFLNSSKCSVSNYQTLDLFEDIDSINFQKNGSHMIATVNGTVCLYGIQNEYGFYAVENDTFIANKTIDEDDDMKVEDIQQQNLLVKRRLS